jgi:HD-like signal output (HDOD) protein/CheY-like chemotaxis protein
MKHKILFVDDEALVLQGLQRTMRSMRNDWDMNFVDCGAKALEFMSATPVDVVVTDMRMPGMNGAELLAEVMKRHPRTVRLVLSGHADQDLILKCVGSTHQYLSKPCDPETLRATVTRALDLESSLKNERLQKLIAQMEHLPSVPSLYSELVDLISQPDTSLEEVGNVIARDLGMTAKILKLVNSAFFGLRREVSSPTEAVTYIGLDTIKSLVLSLNAFSQYEGNQSGGFSLGALWSHSLSTATAAKFLAKFEKADSKTVDEAFVAGLLHDAGKAALAFNFPDQYGETLRLAAAKGGDPLAAEQETFGATHAEVGGYLLGLWGLPFPVVEAIALHHEPARSVSACFSPLTAVHVANVLVAPVTPGGPALLADLKYLNQISLGDRLEVWREELSKHPPTEN